MTGRERIRQVLEKWFLVEPLLFSVWTTHTLTVEPRTRTIRVGHGRVEYNPDFIEALTPPQLDAVLRFEALRILLKHPYARRKENAELAYRASNLTLQEYLQTELPFPRARELFGSEEWDQQYFEFYYYRLQEMADSENAECGIRIAEWKRAEGEGGGGESPQGEAMPLEVYSDPAMSGAENTEDWGQDELLSDRIDEKIRGAQECDGWGTLGGRLRQRILAALRPKLDYRAVLRQFRSSILSVQRSLTRMKPSRRYGFLYMGSRRDFSTRLLFAVDVSGSIGDEDLERGFSVINQFFKYAVPSVEVIQFDTEIKGRPLSLKRARHAIQVKGRGGTDFSPVMEYIDVHREYDGLIVFTDGCAPVPPPPKNRRTRVLWLFNRESSYRESHQRLRGIGRAVFLKEE